MNLRMRTECLCYADNSLGRHKYDSAWSFDKGDSHSNQKGDKDKTE